MAAAEIKDKGDPESVKQFAYEICQEYLAGVWKLIPLDQVEITRLTGGLINFVYKCSIKDKSIKPVGTEPNSILLRLYGGGSHQDQAAILKDTILSSIMGCNGLGPKLYGVFPSGRLEEFFDVKHMAFEDPHNPKYSEMIARVTARFHVLEVPISKEPEWLIKMTEGLLKSMPGLVFTKEADIKRYQTLMSYNLEDELAQLRKVLKSVKSPVVFSHNDIQPGNILPLEDRVVLIDYEFGAYNNRGFDIGNHFVERMYYNDHDEYPFFFHDFSRYPTRDQQLDFIRAYIDETVKIRGGNKADHEDLDEEKILKEAQHYGLISHIIAAAMSCNLAVSFPDGFSHLDYALSRSATYFKLKKALFPDGYKIDGSLLN